LSRLPAKAICLTATESHIMSGMRKKITVPDLETRRLKGPPISMLTCYDAAFASLLDECEVDALLVGDSLGMVLQGHNTTIPVTIEQMEYHTSSVARANPKSLIVADMPFASYHESPEHAFRNAAKLIAAGAQMVKLEGGEWLAPTVEFMSRRGVPVCAHLGLTPQSVHDLGGYRVQGRDSESALKIERDAKALESAGARMLVLELVPADLAAAITQSLNIPTIGIGAGAATTGQVLVLHDMLGITPGKRPRFVKNFLANSGSVASAVKQYVAEVQARSFPSEEHSVLELVSL